MSNGRTARVAGPRRVLTVNRRTVPERYVTLCLRVGARIEGFVDAYFGPAALKEEALADGPHDPRGLRDEALALLEETTRAGLEDDRVQWLLGQLRGIECVTARLAGVDIAWSEEVERCFGVRPVQVDEGVFRASHQRLDGVLPGSGDVHSRYNAWLDAATVPKDGILPGIGILTADLRCRTAEIVDLPPEERVEWETVSGPVWEAFNDYRGDLRSVVQVNDGFPVSLTGLLAIAAHEAYPGHHTERTCKEKLLYRDKGRAETCLTIVSSPEALITEGIATNALEEAAGHDGFGPLLKLVADLGVHVDPEVAEVVHTEELVLYSAATNAARMLHEDGITRADAESYVQEWTLESPERAAKTVSFLIDPELRTYVTAYTDGKRICREFMDRSSEGFRRLLTEQLTVSSLLGTGA
jgi:hypothetical protein